MARLRSPYEPCTEVVHVVSGKGAYGAGNDGADGTNHVTTKNYWSNFDQCLRLVVYLYTVETKKIVSDT